ncbi:hypothetical protein L873DRAFT_1847783 [Choiromyces venosus 120613-1]|uniref:Uncharacterized protein n=1 Tax=Choiromyces venosus 120613-1 TaxID=1336337 RepID=A0A3N4J1X3_9PEZI|nr:hypothetical protein L873DRAFT_1847783 [Choiromyces venosus 120613-1]
MKIMGKIVLNHLQLLQMVKQAPHQTTHPDPLIPCSPKKSLTLKDFSKTVKATQTWPGLRIYLTRAGLIMILYPAVVEEVVLMNYQKIVLTNLKVSNRLVHGLSILTPHPWIDKLPRFKTHGTPFPARHLQYCIYLSIPRKQCFPAFNWKQYGQYYINFVIEIFHHYLQSNDLKSMYLHLMFSDLRLLHLWVNHIFISAFAI